MTKSVFPEDARAVIYKPAPSAMTSGRAHAQQWKLRFERRSPAYIEPLMGWTGGDDTLAQVELSFPAMESAIAYARRQGLQYTVQAGPEQGSRPRLISDNPDARRAAGRQRRLEWVERTLGPEMLRRAPGPGIGPAASYPDPQDVLRDDGLTPERKREMLRRWALDAYQIEIEHSKGKSLDQPSRLEEVIDALLNLEEAHITPASFQHAARKAG
ncbi:ETC complex I subunit [Bradyrhizobium sp. 149]|uniref:ETC complex I subunit n=1 Tax=Bradyrhizobium sp. 149 TaxID=2782624 RepID=UPI001FF7E3AC